ncbi:Fic family protein [Candidatus Gracilibacteria bacterium]|nr:Fic family protein [Candidatus Gracilibacteria bacterium]
MQIEIGKNIQQKEGFSAFIPHPFPPKGLEATIRSLGVKAAKAERYVGKLDGITHTLPNVDFFLKMFELKDATSSAQIEGTKATMIDALEKKAGVATKDTDADDILYYIKALHYGMQRIKTFPISLRLIKELHSKLMDGARASHYADPGNFRKTQNWIGGTLPSNASYVPPPAHEIKRTLGDLEKFIYEEKTYLPLIHSALIHAQFESIHPFLDGNGRMGRLLITMLWTQREILEKPVLFLSSYFKKHQKIYYQKLQNYHEGDITAWVEFFLDGIIETAKDSIEICRKITTLWKKDMAKMQALAKREATSGVSVLEKLYGEPIISSKTIMKWTGFTRAGAQKLIDRFIKLSILEVKNEVESYDRTYIYKDYLNIFIS